MFTAFADINIDSNGFRRLIYGGHRFGHRKLYDDKTQVIWNCTSNYHDPSSGKWKRCNAKVRTCLIDGYEMVENVELQHGHKPFFIDRR